MKKIIISIFALFLFSNLWAQQHTLYFMDAVPGSRYNPAAQPTNTWFLGFPGLNGIETRITTPKIRFKDVVEVDGETMTIDLDKFSDQLSDVNRISSQLSVPVIAFGFKTKKLYWDFSVSVKEDIQVAIPKQFLDLFLKGNNNNEFLGKTADFSDFWARNQSYTEISLGVSAEVNEKLRWGFRPKLIFGLASVETRFNQFDYYTDPDSYAVTVTSDAEIRTNMPVEFTTDENGRVEDIEEVDHVSAGNYILTNAGFAADLGAYYQFDDKWEFDVALTDFGFISWGKSPTVLESKGEFTFSGYEYDPDNEDEDFGEQIEDDLTNTFSPVPNNEKYSTWLTPKLFLGARYKIAEPLKIGGLVRTKFYQGRMHPSLTFSANYQPFREINLSASYGMAEGGFSNIGLGVAFNLGAFQLYMVSDNILGGFSYDNTNQLTGQFGINFIFGHKKKKKEKIEEEEKKSKKGKKAEGDLAPTF